MKKLLSLALVLMLALGMLPAFASASDAEIPTVIWYQIGTQPANLAEAVEVMNAYTAEKIGVKVDLRYFGWGDWEAGTNNILNTGEEFDIMFTNGRHFTGHAMQGKFLDMKDLIKTAAPALDAFVPADLWKAVTIKGGVYAVPTYKDSSQTQYMVWDKAIVEKYGIDITKASTFEELDPILRQIKEGEEKETGTTVYPLTMNKEGFNGILMYYDNYVAYDDATATATSTFVRPEVVAKLEMLHKWYEDGIINADASTLDENPKYRIVYSAQGFPGADVIWSTNGGYDAISYPWSISLYSTESILGSVNAISANSKNPEAALKYLELANTDPTLRNMLAYGIPDADWKDNGDGTITRLGDTWTAPGYSQATFFTMSPVAPNPADQWALVQKQNEDAIGHAILGFTLDDTNIANERTEVDAIVEKYKPELLTGCYKGTTADYLKKMNDELAVAGMDKVLAEIQTQVNAFLGK